MPNLSHPRLFWSKCWYITLGKFAIMLESQSSPATLEEYVAQSKAYKHLDLDTKKVDSSMNVACDENDEGIRRFEK